MLTSFRMAHPRSPCFDQRRSLRFKNAHIISRCPPAIPRVSSKGAHFITRFSLGFSPVAVRPRLAVGRMFAVGPVTTIRPLVTFRPAGNSFAGEQFPQNPPAELIEVA